MSHDCTDGQRSFFDSDDFIVSKTDLTGRLTYANLTFLEIAGYDEDEVIGQPHSMIRHPDMPRCVFKLLWDTLKSGREIFAYVVNLAKNGDHYWVIAHVTPSFDASGQIVGYHSTRRVPIGSVVKDTIIPLYKELKAIEEAPANRKDGMEKAGQRLLEIMRDKGVDYDELIASLSSAA